ncbi:MAG: mechanosensitive ion channel family protein [Microcoleaceae cyanobacterium]
MDSLRLLQLLGLRIFDSLPFQLPINQETEAIAIGIIKTVFATLLLLVAYLLLNRIFTVVRRKVQQLSSKYARTIRIRGKDLIQANQIVKTSNLLVQVIHTTLILVILAFYLSSLLASFPHTEEIFARIFSASLPFRQAVAGVAKVIIIGLVQTILATIALSVARRWLKRGFKFTKKRVNYLSNKYARTVRMGSRDLVRRDQIIRFSRISTKVIYITLLAGLFALYSNTVLSFFPYTRNIASGIFSSILSTLLQIAQTFINYIPKLIFLIIISFIAFYAIKITRFLFEEIEKGEVFIPGFDREWAVPSSRIAQVLILALFLVVAFPYLPGAGSNAFQGISIFLGVLLSLGSSSAVSNAIAGILLTYTRAFRIGDEVQIGDVAGILVEKGWLVTRLRNDCNYLVSVPNSVVLGSNVINRKAFDSVEETEEESPPMVKLEVGLEYDVPWRKVYELLMQAAEHMPDALDEPAPEVVTLRLEGHCIVYELAVYTTNPLNRGEAVRSQMIENVRDQFHQAGIRMLSPQHMVYHQSQLLAASGNNALSDHINLIKKP